MWTTDTFSGNLVSCLCLKWTKKREIVENRDIMQGLRPLGEWGRREVSKRTSIKGLRLPGEWGGREASERTSIKGLRPPGE